MFYFIPVLIKIRRSLKHVHCTQETGHFLLGICINFTELYIFYFLGLLLLIKNHFTFN